MIKRNRYSTITNELSFAIRANEGILESVNQIQSDVSALIDLLDEENVFENNTGAFALTQVDTAADEYENNINSNNIESFSLDGIVNALQDHIETHYTEINSYLVSNSLKLREEFANKSTELSYPVNRSNYLYLTVVSEGLLKVSSNITVSFDADPLETATIRINEVDFIVQKNSSGNLVWDLGEAGQHEFTSEGETISRTAGSQSFDITYQGTPGLLFDIDLT